MIKFIVCTIITDRQPNSHRVSAGTLTVNQTGVLCCGYLACLRI